jgi:hypothetical protein
MASPLSSEAVQTVAYSGREANALPEGGFYSFPKPSAVPSLASEPLGLGSRTLDAILQDSYNGVVRSKLGSRSSQSTSKDHGLTYAVLTVVKNSTA